MTDQIPTRVQLALNEINEAGTPLTVEVEGRQFYWRYVYPNGAVSVNELRLPAGRPVDLLVTAPANDVIHSWWVPAHAGKIDAIFEATDEVLTWLDGS